MLTKSDRGAACSWGALVFLLFSGLEAEAAIVLDESLQGSTTGTRSGGAFVTGGWQVTGQTDTIYWHVATITNGAAEFDVRGIHPNECRAGMEDKVELWHVYDYTFGNADLNYNGGYRDDPYKHFIRKTDCLDTARVNSMEIVWQIQPNYVGQGNTYWPTVASPTSGCDRNIGSTKGGEFVCFPMGILGGGVTLRARRAVKFQVFNPLTGAVVSNVTMNVSNSITLPQGPGAYVLKASSFFRLSNP